MTIVISQDSKRNTYQIWKQEQPASCAVASIWMARGLAKQMSFAEEEWDLAWRVYQHTVVGLPVAFSSSAAAPTGPLCIDASAVANNQSTFYNMFGRFGTFAGQVAQALTSEGLKATHVQGSTLPMRLNVTKLGQRTPAIVLLGWYSQQPNGQLQRNGGHFIVAADRIGNNIVFLDPWDAALYELPNTVQYNGNGLF